MYDNEPIVEYTTLWNMAASKNHPKKLKTNASLNIKRKALNYEEILIYTSNNNATD